TLSGEWSVNVSFLSREVIQEGNSWGEFTVYANNTGTQKENEADKLIWTSDNEESFSLTAFDDGEVFQEEKRWYKGDFHTHTTYTDGEMTREENITMAKKQN